MHQATYRFFDAPFVLETDSPAFLARFERAYGRFRVAGSLAAPVYRVLLSGRSVVAIDGQTVRTAAASAEALGHYAYNAILNAATARVRSHYLLHGAALHAPGERGVILAGHAGLGKTTLTLALLERGWGFFSDDVAAVGRSDGLLYPFPRRMGVRFAGGGPGEKRLLDVVTVASPCPAHVLFLLAEAETRSAVEVKPPWYLVLDRMDGSLLEELRGLDDVWAAEVARSGPYPAVRVDLAAGALPTVESQVDSLCRRRGVLLFEMVQGRETPPDFSAAPRLELLSASEAAHELLHHLKGGPRSALLHEEFGGSAPQLYVALTRLTAGMACFRLQVGQLAEMVEAILSATERPQRHKVHQEHLDLHS
jgi:hypothetical protein